MAGVFVVTFHNTTFCEIPSGSFTYIWSDDPDAKIALGSIATHPEDEYTWWDTGYPYEDCEISYDGENWELYDDKTSALPTAERWACRRRFIVIEQKLTDTKKRKK